MNRIACCIKHINFSVYFILLVFFSVYAAGSAQELVVGCGADQYSKAKHYLSFAKKSPYVWITEPLVYRGTDFKPRPGLIESWERNGNLFTLHIRKSVRFHNGQELDANAIVSSLRINALNRSETLRIKPESYRILDNHTLEIETEHTTVHFIGFLSHPLSPLMRQILIILNTPLAQVRMCSLNIAVVATSR